ncbi:MAG: hypothetical protein ACQEP2_01785 [Actinomycetota bacterium]
MRNLNSILLTNPKVVERDSAVILTRASMARNLADYKFSILNNATDRKNLFNLIKQVTGKIDKLGNFRLYNLSNMPKLKRKLLLEKDIISHQMTREIMGKGILVNNEIDEMLASIMVNEEDHLVIQCSSPGLKIEKVYHEVSKVEKCLEDKLSFAFDRDLGYLTSCPINVGSGFKLSVALHLPAMVVNYKIDDLVDRLNKINCTISGYRTQDSEIIGNLFILSKQSTLEKGDRDTVEEMKAICLNIIDGEKKQIENLKKEKPLTVKDSVYRAYGVLKYARLLSFEEALELLSMVSLGKQLGLFSSLKRFDFYYLINIIGNSYLRSLDGNKNKSIDEIDRKRANIIKEEIF